MLIHNKYVLKLGGNGDLKHQPVEIKRTEECVHHKLPVKMGELFGQMYVGICSHIIKSATEG